MSNEGKHNFRFIVLFRQQMRSEHVGISPSCAVDSASGCVVGGCQTRTQGHRAYPGSAVWSVFLHRVQPHWMYVHGVNKSKM